MSSKINTKNYEDTIGKVLIDNREGDRIDYALKQYNPFNPEVMQLDIGDYIFQSKQTNKNGKPLMQVVFEYKRGDDFLNSINSPNHRLHNQVYHMVTNYDYTFVIVECPDLHQQLDELYYTSGVNMSIQQLNGAIAEFSTSSTVLFTQTQYQAFDLMMRTAGKIFQNKPLRYKYGKKSTNWALNILTGMRGMDNTAELIVRELNLHTISDIMNLTKEDLLSIKGVGEKTATNIIKNIGEYDG